MYLSEVRNCVKRERGNFIHRRYFETLEEGLEWARELASRIVDAGRWSDEEIVMEHSSNENFTVHSFKLDKEVK